MDPTDRSTTQPHSPDPHDHGFAGVWEPNSGGLIALCRCGWTSAVQQWSRSDKAGLAARSRADAAPSLFDVSAVTPVAYSNREEAERAAIEAHRAHQMQQGRAP